MLMLNMILYFVYLKKYYYIIHPLIIHQMFHNYAFKQAYKVLETDKLAAIIININIFIYF
jgi:hypothetical protein